MNRTRTKISSITASRIASGRSPTSRRIGAAIAVSCFLWAASMRGNAPVRSHRNRFCESALPRDTDICLALRATRMRRHCPHGLHPPRSRLLWHVDGDGEQAVGRHQEHQQPPSCRWRARSCCSSAASYACACTAVRDLRRSADSYKRLRHASSAVAASSSARLAKPCRRGGPPLACSRRAAAAAFAATARPGPAS